MLRGKLLAGELLVGLHLLSFYKFSVDSRRSRVWDCWPSVSFSFGIPPGVARLPIYRYREQVLVTKTAQDTKEVCCTLLTNHAILVVDFAWFRHLGLRQ